MKARRFVIAMIVFLAVSITSEAARLPVKKIVSLPYEVVYVSPTTTHRFAMGLNRSGDVVSSGYDVDGSHGYVNEKKLLVGSQANAINDKGVVVGQYQDDQGCQIACYWVNGKLRMIRLSDYSIANAINNKGVVVGGAMTYSGQNGNITPFVFEGAKARLISTDSGTALCINQRGRIGGVVYGSGDSWSNGAVWTENKYGEYDQVIMPIPKSAIRSYVTGIDSKGSTVGLCVTASGTKKAIAWSFSEGTYTPDYLAENTSARSGSIQQLGASGLGLMASRATALSLLSLPGDIIRVDDFGRPMAACLGRNLPEVGIVRALQEYASSNEPNSWAIAINNEGQVVGYDDSVALLWEKGGVYDLNTLVDCKDFRLFAAVAINERGQILCMGYCYRTGYTVAVLLSPSKKQK